MTTNCKRCGFEGVYWNQFSATGKWILYENASSNKHFCQDGNLKTVKCKYCPADDLHWAEEVNPATKEKKAVLTESYGLPHSCDERIAFVAKEKQDKKDKYEAIKKQIAAEPNGPCKKCNGRGMKTLGCGITCDCCHGYGHFSEHTREAILAFQRRLIWPNMKDNIYKRKSY